MEKVKIVIGANFGDEGKGLMTDYFCSRFPEHRLVLNVRFNGGAQAGHTVVSPDGRRHVFSHFGSGSFLPNVVTWFGPDFIVNPILFRREYEQLNAMGIYPMVYCHPKCIFTMPQDMMMNQFIEKRRGDKRHGSCGVGIYESLLRSSEFTKDIYMIDLYHASNGPFKIDIDYYGYNRLEKMTGMTLTNDEKKMLINQNIRAHFNDDLYFFMNHVTIRDEDVLKIFDNVVFEGAQGLMLDRSNLEYFPHLTPSNTGIDNVLPFLKDDMDIEVCYVTRPYLTRHGAGRLDGECSREEAGAKIDITNLENEWQGCIRYAPLQVSELANRIHANWQKSYPKTYMSVAVTHMDEVKDQAAFLSKMDNIGITYISHGPTRNNVEFLQTSEFEWE